MIRVVFIPEEHANPVEVREIEPSLEAWQELVGGDIEMHELHFPDALMVFSASTEDRIPNLRASRIARRYGSLDPMFGYVSGDVVITGVPNEFDEDTDCPDEYRF